MQRILEALEHHQGMINEIRHNVDQRLEDRERNKMRWCIGSLSISGLLTLTPVAALAFVPFGAALGRLLISRRDKKQHQETSYLINKPALVEIVEGVLRIGFEQVFVDEDLGQKIKKESIRVEKTVLKYDQDASYLPASLEKAVECTQYEHNLLQWNKNYLEKEIEHIQEAKRTQPQESRWTQRKMLMHQALFHVNPQEYFLSHLEVMAASVSRRRVVQNALIAGKKQLDCYEPQDNLGSAKELQRELNELYHNTLDVAEQNFSLMQKKVTALFGS